MRLKQISRLPYQALTKEQREVGYSLLSNINQEDLIGGTLAVLEDAAFNYCD